MTMTYDELLKYNEHRDLNQFSIIVPDVDEAVKAWVQYAKVGPWRILEYSDKYCDYFVFNGERVTEPFKFIVAIAMVNGIELELIQPCYGPNAYSEFLKEHGACPQHIKFSYLDNESLDAAVKEFEEVGIMPIQRGDLLGNRHYYVDSTPKISCLIELGSKQRSGYPAEEIKWYPEKPKD